MWCCHCGNYAVETPRGLAKRCDQAPNCGGANNLARLRRGLHPRSNVVWPKGEDAAPPNGFAQADVPEEHELGAPKEVAKQEEKAEAPEEEAEAPDASQHSGASKAEQRMAAMRSRLKRRIAAPQPKQLQMQP